MSALAALGKLQSLAQLTLNFSGCARLSEVYHLSPLKALGGLQELAQLTLHFDKDGNGSTALHRAAGSGQAELCKVLWAANKRFEISKF